MVASAGVAATSRMATSSSTGVNHRLLAIRIAPNVSSTMVIRVSFPNGRRTESFGAEGSVWIVSAINKWMGMLLRINRSVKCGSYSLDFDLLRLPRITACSWYHLAGTIFAPGLNQNGTKASKSTAVNPAKIPSGKSAPLTKRRGAPPGRSQLLGLGLSLLLCGVPALAQPQQAPEAP